ncbi:hypothetical protein KKF03_06985, partial [Patescibacteria group bacterium]|nr:hypothetical protein [Patescibacteria group bacterium]
MKQTFIITITIALLVLQAVSADILPVGKKGYTRCTKIVNTEEFPDAYFISHLTGPMIQGHENSLIDSDECLYYGYKFNTLQILAVSRDYVNTVGIDNIEASDPEIMVSDEDSPPATGYNDEDSPIIKETTEYSIAGFSENGLILYKSR